MNPCAHLVVQEFIRRIITMALRWHQL